ncbi:MULTISPECIES: hypothetical protein [Brevibacillus]|jgi:hypothetical protein|uniref:hypothetical protein n=1 Tax=Brevibacillus TaxID=55080 RepID=UPI0004F3EB10|nr:hypothetical protein [Brevibacillus borstelensis]KKX52589.1 hypothetical protein X546_24085 [Brevibacillus borstelensis cifa_chp40]MBE5395704.1 hypothetical protein [Brevibacillus borstelensis]MCC0565106.1 hypothetical protein [Brevibacillus borstelensis]MCM3471847.1 hypothetical protein [Brevibacillus borstelensis]MCM3561080.1 hypothetical protein [Brevibacillus borstelensis]
MKKVFLAGDAYSSRFFDLSLDDEELSLMPWIAAASYHVARFALLMQDDGLAGLGISSGDALLISDFSMEPITGRPVLVRQEGQYIVRIAKEVNPVECVFTCTNDLPPLILPSENIRITGVVSGIISEPAIHRGIDRQ